MDGKITVTILSFQKISLEVVLIGTLRLDYKYEIEYEYNNCDFQLSNQ